MEAIRMWLNGDRNYIAGEKLYSLYGNDPLLKKLFAERPVSRYKEQTLLESLQKLLTRKEEKKPEPVIPKPTIVERARQEKEPDHGWSKNMDEVEAALHAQWKPLFLEMMDRCSRMEDLAIAARKDPGRKAESCQNALRILKLDEMCDALYAQRDAYKNEGTMPVEKNYDDLCMDPLLIPKKLENAKRYVRDYKNKLKKDPANVEAAQQLKKWEGIVEHYKKELNLQ